MNWYKKAKKAKDVRLITSATIDWYDFYRYAQIWNVEYNGSGEELASQIAAMYELEYKFSMLRTRPFRGMPKRRENILNQLQNKLSEVILMIRDRLVPVFWKWLEFHALLSPETWARKRVAEEVEGGEIQSAYENAISEYDRYVINSGRQSNKLNSAKTFMGMIGQATSNISNFPALARLFSLGLVDYKDSLKEDLSGEGIEAFGERYGKEFKDINEAELFVDNLTINDVDPEYLLYFEDMSGFVDSAERMGYAEDILVELLKNLVFPGWFDYWGAQGIEETRENLENIYKELKAINPEDVGNGAAIISIALNASHQNGSMLDHIENDTGESSTEIKHTLDEMSRGVYVEKWNKQLREIGVQI